MPTDETEPAPPRKRTRSFRYGALVVALLLVGWGLWATSQHLAQERARIAKLQEWQTLPREQWPKRLLELDKHLAAVNSGGLDEVLYQDYGLQYSCKFTDDRQGLATFLNAEDFPNVGPNDPHIERALKNIPPPYQPLVEARGEYDYFISKSWRTDLVPHNFGWWCIIQNKATHSVVIQFSDPYQ